MNVAVRSISEVAAVMPELAVMGMFGIGDSLHQRAVLRELMKTHSVTVQSFYTAMYHDLVAYGLKVVLRGRITPRIKDGGNRNGARSLPVAQARIGYTPEMIKRHGSILAAMYASVGLAMPEAPDFGLPVKEEWRRAARALMSGWSMRGKPLMVYRPVVLNKVWECPARSPDCEVYATLYRSIRDRFFVVSICDLTQGGERIVGPEVDVDVKLHRGEADFETLAGLFAEAALVFANPGFAPVLAQALGTPNVCVYGANESYRTTNSVGSHLAPTLAIEPIAPCECHARFCKCSKAIDMPTALEKVRAFVSKLDRGRQVDCIPDATRPDPRVLIFATTYVDTAQRLRLTYQWAALHKHLNPECDLLMVDSKSPLLWDEDGGPAPGLTKVDCPVYSFPENIGHLSRNGPGGPASKGRDGWGRAFCEGLNRAVLDGYDYAVHIEGDSLFRLPVMPIVRQMRSDGAKVASVPVEGTRRKEVGWVETGLMFFDCAYVRDTRFTDRYDWANRKQSPTPEKVIFNILGKDLKMMPWRAERGDKSQITVENVTNLDWVTHCHDRPAVYDRFVAAAKGEPVRLNFGCGTNRLEGWANYDAEIDITKRLPFFDAYADFILAEHVVEHVEYKQALAFMRECRRVLKPGGVARFAVPSIEKVWRNADAEYFAFVKRWAKQEGVRPAIDALLNCHGHKAPWTESLLLVTAFQAGFDTVKACEPGQSDVPDLQCVDGHGKVIGDKFNRIETIVCEAS